MSLSEDNLVAWLQQQCHAQSENVLIGIGDDMAQVGTQPGISTLITTDMLLEGVHFDLSLNTLEQVGYKAMGASLSDCAAMATRPLAAVVSIGLPAAWGKSQLKDLYAGLLSAAQRFGCPVVGGDMTCWRNCHGRLVVNVSMLSTPAYGPPVRRSGAQPGDLIYVTGTLGGSLKGRHVEFTPRLLEAKLLVQHVQVHAMIDLSDGLSTDLGRICRASHVGATLNAADVPLSDTARSTPDPLNAALHDGEDFELLFTLAPDQAEKLSKIWQEPVRVTRVGMITQADGMEMIRPDGTRIPLEPHGYDHFDHRIETTDRTK